MKVLYIGNFHDGTGWSRAANLYVKALVSVGVDVVCRSIKLNGVAGEADEVVADAEKKDASNPDIIIQHLLPHMMVFNGKVKNIGLSFFETDNFNQTINWTDQLNLMDEVWVACEDNRQTCYNSNVKNVSVIPCPVDIEKSEGFREKKNTVFPAEMDSFKFYYIGELTPRKNLAGLLRAFHTEFSPHENVDLVLKIAGAAPEKVNEYVNDVKTQMKLYKDPGHYKSEILIWDFLTEEQMSNLHMACDCFLTSSYGEAICLPAIDAMSFGNPVIVPKHGGFVGYVNDGNGFFVNGRLDFCYGTAGSTFNDLYTGRERWFVPSVEDMMKQMRKAYNMSQSQSGSWNCMKEQATKATRPYSFPKIGLLMKERLECILAS